MRWNRAKRRGRDITDGDLAGKSEVTSADLARGLVIRTVRSGFEGGSYVGVSQTTAGQWEAQEDVATLE
ncbi:uncharacterized protein SCHCODRAFT_02641586 [Schizophyllum commune H4-8]|uniref:uncharacterized protein n=1 Tax=Schizophyllum commune (strain H4-8 / FGSC 9210) TaxID=578458 RepID=UPI00215E81E7|nr:uncharacterized protein SCHCODRAFT_02641586 [Schizophyllum commune H4-8]KAI5886378.1 hypothetical protein SCHCODRAFT_02641586 [Schizophyllum commune H4-8]